MKDATGFSVCYVYARKDEALRSSYMTHAEAIAKLPVNDKVVLAGDNLVIPGDVHE